MIPVCDNCGRARWRGGYLESGDPNYPGIQLRKTLQGETHWFCSNKCMEAHFFSAEKFKKRPWWKFW